MLLGVRTAPDRRQALSRAAVPLRAPLSRGVRSRRALRRASLSPRRRSPRHRGRSLPALWPTSRRPPVFGTEAVLAPSVLAPSALAPLLCASYATSLSPFCRQGVADFDLTALGHDATTAVLVRTSENLPSETVRKVPGGTRNAGPQGTPIGPFAPFWPC